MICPIRRKPPNRLQPFVRFGAWRARPCGTDGGGTLAEPVTPPARPAEILTARLRLVPLKPADLDDLARMYADPEVMLGSSGVGSVRSREIRRSGSGTPWSSRQHRSTAPSGLKTGVTGASWVAVDCARNRKPLRPSSPSHSFGLRGVAGSRPRRPAPFLNGESRTASSG